uniref:Uncharacterized protein n=1 Tax=Octopus bimaculoides TaxID=37653 RepID=A0A0L8G2Z0_OCTBM
MKCTTYLQIRVKLKLKYQQSWSHHNQWYSNCDTLPSYMYVGFVYLSFWLQFFSFQILSSGPKKRDVIWAKKCQNNKNPRRLLHQ